MKKKEWVEYLVQMEIFLTHALDLVIGKPSMNYRNKMIYVYELEGKLDDPQAQKFLENKVNRFKFRRFATIWIALVVGCLLLYQSVAFWLPHLIETRGNE